MSTKKRALIFSTTYFPLVAGAEVAMKEVTDRLPDWQFDLFCARLQPGLVSTERIGNVTVHRCGVGKSVDKYLLPITAVWRALRVGGFGYHGVIWSLMASYGGFAALTYTWFRPSVQMLLTLQEGDPLEHYTKRTGVLTFLHKKIFIRANAIQSISRFLAGWATKMGYKGTPEIIPNGVDIARFSEPISSFERERLRRTFGCENSDVVIITVSRLTLKNGVDDIIRSLTFLPANYKLLVAGIGEDRDKLIALAEAKGVKGRVIFLGMVGREELPAVLRSADIFCRPSLSEGLGVAFLEAMVAELPTIATPVGGIPDFLKDGETGVFCQPRDPESLAKAVFRIQQESGLRDRLIRQGAALMREEYHWDGIAKRIGNMLERLNG